MEHILNLIKGIFMGVANIIPGVSGGTMAVSLGVYDSMIHAISHLFLEFKKSLTTLIPILLGMGIGIVGFTYVIEYLLKNHTLPTCLTFIGLIIGGLPILLQKFNDCKGTKPFSIINIVLFLAFFGLVIGLSIFNSTESGLMTFEINLFTLIKLFLVGIIAAATMVIPGVSGSLVLMILGYYYGILNLVRNFFDSLKSFNLDLIIKQSILLIPFGLGVVIGIFVISKIIEYLFNEHSVSTYCAILGLIIASPIAIFMNTNALANFPIIGLIVGIALGIVGAYTTYKLGTLE
ncbi:hypothetical protein P261_00028 [Lachnospiraceae bacterium TWA4]|nr:hypothetical protein P261_00028 [Lachnospiraceae bacterium TWA4]